MPTQSIDFFYLLLYTGSMSILLLYYYLFGCVLGRAQPQSFGKWIKIQFKQTQLKLTDD